MRTLAILISMGVLMAAEEPKPKPEAVKPEAVKTATVDTDKLENLELKIQILNTQHAKLIEDACRSIGGKVIDDCIPMPRQQGQPLVLRLKPVAAAKPEAAKEEVK